MTGFLPLELMKMTEKQKRRFIEAKMKDFEPPNLSGIKPISDNDREKIQSVYSALLPKDETKRLDVLNNPEDRKIRNEEFINLLEEMRAEDNLQSKSKQPLVEEVSVEKINDSGGINEIFDKSISGQKFSERNEKMEKIRNKYKL